MAQTDGLPDHAAPELVTDGISPKAIVATVWALLLSIAVPGVAAILEYVSSNPDLFAGLHPVVRVGITAVVVAAGTALAAYRAKPGAVGAGNG